MVGWLRFLVAERFNNLEMIQKTTCPTFILHGTVDEVIAVHHGRTLRDNSKAEPLVYLEPRHMSHNDFRMREDLMHPMKNFLAKAEIETATRGGSVSFKTGNKKSPFERTGPA